MPGWTGWSRKVDGAWRPARLASWRRLLAWCLVAALACLAALPAQARAPEVEQLELHRDLDGLLLSARLGMDISPAVEDALLRGVPLYFVWRAELYRERWYWTDKRVTTTVRTMRLAYQPLTRQWRLSVAAEMASNGSSLQYAVHQTFESLEQAKAAITRLVRWRLARPEDLQPEGTYRAVVTFRLDRSLLPRPFQIGLVNQPEWDIELRLNMIVPHVVAPVTDISAPAGAGG
jgi:hypothetical protein